MSDRPQVLPADPKASYLAHKDAIDAAVRRVLDRGWYILGQEVAAFEHEFARFLGIQHTLGVGSGTDALHLALRVAGIGPGDLVFTVSHTAVATVVAIELAGATPVLVDIDPRTYTLDPNRLEDTLKLLGESMVHAKAIIPVHLYGHPADMPALMDLAQRYGLTVIEDCAQSHGALLNGQMTGTFGQMAAFSFYPTKNLGALGDGGAVATNDPELATRARLLREYGWRERYVSELAGMNTRLDEMQAAILRVKLAALAAENARRRELAALYDRALESTSLEHLRAGDHVQHVYHLYVVRESRRDALKSALQSQGVGTAIHYPVPVHLQPAYCDRIRLGAGGLPHTERAAHTVLSLPMYPQLTDEQVSYVCEQISRWRAP